MNYWVVLHLREHQDHRVSHRDRISLKSYFDEKPMERSDETAEGDRARAYYVPFEHSAALDAGSGNQIIHAIDRHEYEAESFSYYVWGEPYGSIAFSHAGYYDGLLVGRLKLTIEQLAHRGPASGMAVRPHNIDENDFVLHFVFFYGNSVVQYIADQMNKNIGDSRLETIRLLNEDAAYLFRLEAAGDSNTYANHGAYDDYTDAALALSAEANFLFAKLVHADPHPEHNWGQMVTQAFQEFFFEGGGEWDHKPRIYPVWGTDNRIGNRGLIYYYDIWSNIHFGFVGAAGGFPVGHLIDQAGDAQVLDNLATGDDKKDQEATMEGFDLYFSKKRLTYRDLIPILERHPNWAIA